jgi:hypothetical protein
MAEGIGWKTTELQIETLIPGILAVCSIDAALCHCNVPTNIQLLSWNETFAKGALFVSLAYATGAIGGVFCRAIIDSLSERYVRAWIFTFFSHVSHRQLIRNRLLNDKIRFKADYKLERKKKRSPSSALWNSAYRSALSTTSRKAEVDRRRSQGRIVRNLALPAALWAAVIFVAFSPLPKELDCAAAIFLGFVVFIFWVFPYAYAEYINFAEAFDITRELANQRVD